VGFIKPDFDLAEVTSQILNELKVGHKAMRRVKTLLPTPLRRAFSEGP
jgi:hypothetical protein